MKLDTREKLIRNQFTLTEVWLYSSVKVYVNLKIWIQKTWVQEFFFCCSRITFFITHPTLHFQSWLGNWCKFQALFWEHTLNIHCTCPPVFLGNPECKILILFISQEYWSFIRRICWKWISFILASFFPSYQMTYLQLLFSKQLPQLIWWNRNLFRH